MSSVQVSGPSTVRTSHRMRYIHTKQAWRQHTMIHIVKRLHCVCSRIVQWLRYVYVRVFVMLRTLFTHWIFVSLIFHIYFSQFVEHEHEHELKLDLIVSLITYFCKPDVKIERKLLCEKWRSATINNLLQIVFIIFKRKRWKTLRNKVNNLLAQDIYSDHK